MTVGASEFAFEPLLYVQPETGLQGKFSMYYCVASALVHGKVDLSTFSDGAVRDAAVVALIPKITMEVDERVRHDREFAAIVTVETEQSERLEQQVHVAPGKPARWLTSAQLKEKFRDCCAYSERPVKAADAFAALQSIERVNSLSDVLPLVTTA